MTTNTTMKALPMDTTLFMRGTPKEVAKAIREALKVRTGQTWSVTNDRGTAYGWLKIASPPKRQDGVYGYMSDDDRALLGEALGLNGPVHQQGESVPSSPDYYREYLERAHGQPVTKKATPYWD